MDRKIPQKIRIAFMGTSSFVVDILNSLVAENLDHRYLNDEVKFLKSLKAVWTSPARSQGRGLKVVSSPVQDWAERHQIPCYSPTSLSYKDVSLLEDHQIDLVFVVSYGMILPQFFFDFPVLGSYNLHFSLLPRYRGASPLQSAIIEGDRETGITFQTVASKVDTGKIVLQKKILLENLTYQQSLNSCIDLAKKYFDKFLKRVINVKRNPQNNIPAFVEQDEQKVIYCKKIFKEDGKIIRSDSIDLIYRKYLAYQGWPGVFFISDGIKYDLIEIQLIAVSEIESLIRYSDDRGETDSTLSLMKLGMNLFLVKNKQILKILKIKKQGKKILPVSDFLNGCNLTFPLSLF